VDTGWGTIDYQQPARGVQMVGFLTGSRKKPEEAVIRQIERLGYKPEDVKHIVMTHMHVDHCGGLGDFLQAKVHLYQEEYDAIMHPRGLFEKWFYIPRHWAHGPDWVVHKLNGAQWFDFPCTDPLPIEGLDIRMIPFHGHSRGLCAIAIALPGDRWLMHCGDVYAHRNLVDLSKPLQPPPKFLLRIPLIAGMLHVPKLRALKEQLGERLTMFCSHDPVEFERLAKGTE